jgi:tRNA G46 methylase TrmB
MEKDYKVILSPAGCVENGKIVLKMTITIYLELGCGKGSFITGMA